MADDMVPKMESSDEQDSSHLEELQGSGRRTKKKCNRHTPYQIKMLEKIFNYIPHPDENQRMQLSQKLGLQPKQIKFWFQNRRTQQKTLSEREDNSILRIENERIRRENIVMKEVLKNATCLSCDRQMPIENFLVEQRPCKENVQFKEEPDCMSSIVSRCLGRPTTQISPNKPILHPGLGISIGDFGEQGCISPSLNNDMLSQCSTPPLMNPPIPAVPKLDKTIFMVNLAKRAAEELILLMNINEPLWLRSEYDQIEVLHLDAYNQMFQRPERQLHFPNFHIEGSRDMAFVPINSESLVEIFMDTTKWLETFSTIVNKARIIEVLVPGQLRNRIGSLVLMHEEIHVLSPLVPTRELYFLRYSKQLEPGLWVIADISIDHPTENKPESLCIARKLPSGCLIKDLPNGFSKIIWVEHVEVEEKNPVHSIFKSLVYSGMAFGAHRWLLALQKMCEKNNSKVQVAEVGVHGHILKLAQRMLSSFCANISSSSGYTWTKLPDLHDVGFRVMVPKIINNEQSDIIVLTSVTSVWLPASVERVFNFLKDEKTHVLWDIYSNNKAVKKIAHIPNGSQPENRISLLQYDLENNQNNMVVVQETFIDKWSSVVVYCPISLDILLNGQDPTNVFLLPWGFSIISDGKHSGEGASTSSNPIGGNSGSIVSIMHQIRLNSLNFPEFDIQTINNLMSSVINQLKAGLNSLDD